VVGAAVVVVTTVVVVGATVVVVTGTVVVVTGTVVVVATVVTGEAPAAENNEYAKRFGLPAPILKSAPGVAVDLSFSST